MDLILKICTLYICIDLWQDQVIFLGYVKNMKRSSVGKQIMFYAFLFYLIGFE